jgi:hypothetical protein
MLGEVRVDGLQVLDAIPVRPDVPHVIGADGQLWVLATAAPWARLAPFAETPVMLAYTRGTLVTALVPPASLGDAIRVTALDDEDAAPTFARAFADGTASLGAMRAGRYRIATVRLMPDGTAAVHPHCDLTVARGAAALRVSLSDPAATGVAIPACRAEAARDP